MSKDSSNNDDLKDFLIDENPEEVEKRIKNNEKNSNSEESSGPWDKKNTVNETEDISLEKLKDEELKDEENKDTSDNTSENTHS